jgi:hypothetical protein
MRKLSDARWDTAVQVVVSKVAVAKSIAIAIRLLMPTRQEVGCVVVRKHIQLLERREIGDTRWNASAQLIVIQVSTKCVSNHGDCFSTCSTRIVSRFNVYIHVKQTHVANRIWYASCQGVVCEKAGGRYQMWLQDDR